MNSALKSFAFLALIFFPIGCERKLQNPVSIYSNLVSSANFATKENYSHYEHLGTLRQNVSTLFATNPAIVYKTHGRLSAASPLRAVLNIPVGEEVYASSLQRANDVMSEFELRLQSKKTAAMVGIITVDQHTRQIARVYDAQARAIFEDIRARIRIVVATREEALRLFSRNASASQAERELAVKALGAALMLKPDAKLSVEMSAPGGSNGGTGYLRVNVQDNPYHVAFITYPHPNFEFGGLSLESAWTNWNTKGFLLDSNGCPYPRAL